MSVKVATRNMRNEYRHSFFWNLVVIFAVLLFGDIALHEAGPIGNRIMALMYIVDGGVTLLFMYWMEKYTITISGLYEETVITVLSNIYTFVIVSAINLILFFSKEKLIMDALIMAEKIIGIFIVDFILQYIRNNEKLNKKARLLIIGATASNFSRMKRIK